MTRIIDPTELPESARLPDGHDPLADGILMAHQRDWLADKSDLKCCEKGRRTGITYAEALDDTLIAATRRSDGGDNVFYIGDTREKGLEFIGYCAHFARACAQEKGEITEDIFRDQRPDGSSKDIAAYRIRFNSGFRIAALSSRPENIRGLQGIVVIDEAAFHQDVKEVLRAVNALLIWGGKIRVISTHNGVDSPFYELVQEIRAGKFPYSLHHISFTDAVENGLYERVCLIRGWEPSAEGKADWYARILDSYGNDTEGRDEELFVIARQGSGSWLSAALIERAQDPGTPVLRWRPEPGTVDLSEAERERRARDWCETHLAAPLARLDPTTPHVLGGDFGRVTDRSVFWPLAIEPTLRLRTPCLVELSDVPVDMQRHVITWLIDRLPRFRHAVLDANGSGLALAEAVRQRYGPRRVTELRATEDWYRREMPHVLAAFQDAMIAIPQDRDVRDDLRAVKLIKGVAKIPATVRHVGSDGRPRHGDAAMALAYAHAATRLGAAEYEVQTAPLLGSSRGAGLGTLAGGIAPGRRGTW